VSQVRVACSKCRSGTGLLYPAGQIEEPTDDGPPVSLGLAGSEHPCAERIDNEAGDENYLPTWSKIGPSASNLATITLEPGTQLAGMIAGLTARRHPSGDDELAQSPCASEWPIPRILANVLLTWPAELWQRWSHHLHRTHYGRQPCSKAIHSPYVPATTRSPLCVGEPGSGEIRATVATLIPKAAKREQTLAAPGQSVEPFASTIPNPDLHPCFKSHHHPCRFLRLSHCRHLHVLCRRGP